MDKFQRIDQLKKDLDQERPLHAIILKNNENKNAGVYRSINGRISGSEHIPPHFNHKTFPLTLN